jgi:hypothetical protein
MLRKCALLFLLLAVTPAAPQAGQQPDSSQGTLRVFVEGDPSTSRGVIEALRRSDPPLEFKLEFVSAPADPHQVRLIVTRGSGTAWCNDEKIPRHLSIFFSNTVALAPDGKLLFTVGKSAPTPRQSLDWGAKETIKQLLNHHRGLRVNSPQPDADAGQDQKNAPSISGLPSEPGVYHRADSGWVRLRETAPSSVSNRGVGAALLTGGISGVRVVHIYSEPESGVRLSGQRPSFYVRGYGVADRDAHVLRLAKKKRHREVQIASVSPFNPRHGHRGRDIHKVEIERVSDTIIRITPAAELEPGEYLLLMSKSESADGGYEFSVGAARKQ